MFSRKNRDQANGGGARTPNPFGSQKTNILVHPQQADETFASRNSLRKEHVTELYRSCHDQQTARKKGTESSFNMQSVLQPYMALDLIMDTKDRGLIAKPFTRIEKKVVEIKKITEEKIVNQKQV